MNQKPQEFVLNVLTVLVGIPVMLGTLVVMIRPAAHPGPVEWLLVLILSVLLAGIAVWMTMVFLYSLERLFCWCFRGNSSHLPQRTESDEFEKGESHSS